MELPMKNFSLILSLIISAYLCMFLTLSPPAYATTNVPGDESDKHALLAFKSQINEDPESILDSWNDSSHFCNWTGVTCQFGTPRVIGLNLRQQSLSGTIAPDVGNLSFITFLDLSGNFFDGVIPSELGNLGRLQILNMSNNVLDGRIPDTLSNCSSLRNLALDHNFLTGTIPPEIGSLSELMTMNLGTNNLTGTFPPTFGNLSFLREIDMSYNNLSGEVPITISRLKNLRVFRMSVNNLTGEFPPSLYNLTNLDFLAISFNSFTGKIRDDIGILLPNLERIWLPYNFFAGTIPTSFPNASKLNNIDLKGNNFTGKVPLNVGKLDLVHLSLGSNNLGSGEPDDLSFVTALTNCSNLDFLDFGGNKFGGILPTSIANLSTQLVRLYLEWNSIHGNIPREISNLQNLNILYMNSNNLNGTIPDSLGMLPNLGTLVLGSNQFTGQIPSSLGNNSNLLWLFLFENRLEGGIPSSLASCKRMVFFYIAQNNLIGSIPPNIMSIPTLLSFNVSYNSLTGHLPENVEDLSHLVEIDLSYNNFSGQIPNTLGNCLDMSIVLLQGNSFEGSIPSLARQNLIYVDLSSNKLSGNIPDYFLNMSSLLYLNLSFNDLEGEVPLTGVFANVSVIDVHGNSDLCGGIQSFNLPACPEQEPEKTKKERGHNHTKLILIVVLTLFAALLLSLVPILFIRKRWQKAPESESRSLNFYPKISYEELRNGTGGFSQENLIGSGSFGTVYKGTLTSDGTAVAVKVLNLKRKGASKSFMAECLALRNIRHNNLVKVITACSSVDLHGNDFKALVYQFMSNGSLDKWLHPADDAPLHNSLNILRRIDIAIDIASAIHYLHHQCQTPVIHCDLKPHNILLDSDLMAHIGDFGLARMLTKFSMKDDGNQFSSLGIKGTIGYVAPEYGMGIKVSILGDVYSFGILLLEIFTGKRPTDDLFHENLNLHHFVQMALPDRVMEVLDNSALCEEVTGKSGTWSEGWNNLRSEQQECLIHILHMGVSCSGESPQERMTMRQVCRELSMIRNTFLGIEETKRSITNGAIEGVDAV